jgi:hypothetical protein
MTKFCPKCKVKLFSPVEAWERIDDHVDTRK